MPPPTHQPVVLLVGPAGALSGGDMHALRLAEAWDERPDTAVTVVGSPDLESLLSDSLRQRMVALRSPLDTAMRRSSLALMSGLLWRAIRAVPQCRRASVVVTGSHLIFDVAPAALSRLLFGSPVVTYVFHIIGDIGRPPSLQARTARALESLSLLLLRLVRATVFVDNADAYAGLVRRSFAATRLHRTSNAYNPPFEAPAPDPADPLRLVFVGRLVDQKGIWDVIDVARQLAIRESPIEVDMIGDGPQREALSAVITAEKLHVRLHGFVGETEKWSVLRRGRLFLAPSVEEGWGIAVGEALFAGLPVVAVDLPAYSHISTHLVTAPRGGEPFVDLVLSVLADPGQLDTMARAALAASKTLPRWSDVVSGDLQVLERVAAGTMQG